MMAYLPRKKNGMKVTVINICPASTFTLLAEHFKRNATKYEVVSNMKTCPKGHRSYSSHLDCSWDTTGPDIRRDVIYLGWRTKGKARWREEGVIIYEDI